MEDAYAEEQKTDALNCVLWVNGRLRELFEQGKVKKRGNLTEEDREQYRALVARGWKPDKSKVLLTLQSEGCPEDRAEGFANLMLKKE
jgi:hypothetical protein